MKNKKTNFSRPDQKKPEKNSRTIFKLTCLIFFGVLFYSLFMSEFLKISSVAIVGNSEISSEALEKAIEEEIAGKYLGFISKKNLIIFPFSKIESRLKGDFKKIRGVKAERNFPGGLDFKIDERKTAFFGLSGEKIFAIDENGIAYEEIFSREFSQNQQEKFFLKSGRSEEIVLGEKIFDEDYAAYLARIKKDLFDELGISAGNQAETPSFVSGDIRVKTTEDWKIYLDAQISLEKTVDTLEVFLEKTFGEDGRKNLEYVDLRAENKIFYKMKNSPEIEQDDAEIKMEVKGEEDKKVEEKKDKKKKK